METQNLTNTFSMKTVLSQFKIPTYLPKLLSAGFGVILISWLLSQMEWAETVEIVRSVPAPLLFLGFGAYALSFYLRALRFRILLPPEHMCNNLFSIVLVHYTALNIFPARLGELSYVYLLKKLNKISAEHSIPTLIVSRIVDQIAISCLFLLSSLIVQVSASWLSTLGFMIGAGLGGSVILLIVILTYKKHCLSFLVRILNGLKLTKYLFVQKALRWLEDMISTGIAHYTKRTGILILALSFLIWLNIFAVNYCLIQAFGVELNYATIIFASTFSILLSLFPVQFLNGLGVRETAWVFIVTALGVPKNTAIISSFGTRIVSTLYLVLFALYGFLRISLITQKCDS